MKRKSKRIIENEENIMRAKRIMHTALKLQRKNEEKKHAESTKMKRLMMKKYYQEHPEKQHKNLKKG